MNTYGYVGGNPVKFTDKLGLVVDVIKNGNSLTFSMTVGIHGYNATPELARLWQNAMNDYWNNNGKNHQVGKCNVNFNIKVLANPNPKNVMNNVVVLNKNALVPAEFTASGNNEGRAFVRNGSVGYIYVNNSSAVVAHEAGHLMYADDHYIDNVGPKFGWEYTLMGDPYNVNASTIQDITDVLTNNNKLSECACK